MVFVTTKRNVEVVVNGAPGPGFTTVMVTVAWPILKATGVRDSVTSLTLGLILAGRPTMELLPLGKVIPVEASSPGFELATFTESCDSGVFGEETMKSNLVMLFSALVRFTRRDMETGTVMGVTTTGMVTLVAAPSARVAVIVRLLDPL